MIKKELKAIYPELKEIGVARVRQTDFKNDSLTLILLVKWQGEPAKNKKIREKYEDRLKNFINVKLKDKKIGIINFYSTRIIIGSFITTDTFFPLCIAGCQL